MHKRRLCLRLAKRPRRIRCGGKHVHPRRRKVQPDHRMAAPVQTRRGHRAYPDRISILDEQAAGLQDLANAVEYRGDIRWFQRTQRKAGNDVRDRSPSQTRKTFDQPTELAGVAGQNVQFRKAAAKVGGEPFRAFHGHQSPRWQTGGQQRLRNGAGARPQFQNATRIGLFNHTRDPSGQNWRARASRADAPRVGDQFSAKYRQGF